MIVKRLETPRLILRAYTPDDFAQFYQTSSSPNMGPRAGWQPHKDKVESMAILLSLIRSDEVFAICNKLTGEVMGSIGLHQRRRTVEYPVREVGYVLDPRFWGNGYMTEAVKEIMRYAFCELNLYMLSIGHFDFNDASRRVIEKCRFVKEARLRNVYEYEGKLVGETFYSLTKEEYDCIDSK